MEKIEKGDLNEDDVEDWIEGRGDEALTYFASLGIGISAEQYEKLTIWTDEEIQGLLSGEIQFTRWDMIELGRISESDEGGEEIDLSKEQLEEVRDARRAQLIPLVVEAVLGDLEGEDKTDQRRAVARAQFGTIHLSDTGLLDKDALTPTP